MGVDGARPHSCSARSPFRNYFCYLAIKRMSKDGKREKRAQFRNAPSLVLSVRSEMGCFGKWLNLRPRTENATRLHVCPHTLIPTLSVVFPTVWSLNDRVSLSFPEAAVLSRLTDLFPLVLCVHISPCALPFGAARHPALPATRIPLYPGSWQAGRFSP